MVQIILSEDERYPDFSIDNPASSGKKVEVEEKKLARWKRAIERYEEIQAEMQEVYEAAPHVFETAP